MPAENGRTLKDYSPSKTSVQDVSRISSQLQLAQPQVQQPPPIQSVAHQSPPLNQGGLPIKLVCWKDGEIGTITFTSDTGFQPIE